MRIPFLCSFFLCFFLSGCGVVDYYFLTPPEDTAQELYENARVSMQDKDYPSAIGSLVKLSDQYPFSPYANQARLMLGDAYFLDAQYMEAVDVYEEFLNMHPRDEAVPYVLFQMGVSKYSTHKSIDLPQDELAEAVEIFKRVIATFPQSQYVEQSQEYIGKCRLLIAEHELYVADFYFTSKAYKASWVRYTYVVEHFSDLPDIAKFAESRGKVAYYRYQQVENDAERNPSKLKKLFQWL